jgi:hypothetical protein
MVSDDPGLESMVVRGTINSRHGEGIHMPVWLGQLVISKGTHKHTAFKVQYWRSPSMTPAYLRLDSFEDLRNYLRHCRLSNTTPDKVIEQLRTESQVEVNTIESEEKIG